VLGGIGFEGAALSHGFKEAKAGGVYSSKAMSVLLVVFYVVLAVVAIAVVFLVVKGASKASNKFLSTGKPAPAKAPVSETITGVQLIKK